MFEDRTLQCCDCQSSFVFTAAEQEFFVAKNLTNDPKRCPNCRVLLRFRKSGRDPQTAAEVACASCDVIIRVPFTPRGTKPVYCSTCLHKQRDPSKTD